MNASLQKIMAAMLIVTMSNLSLTGCNAGSKNNRENGYPAPISQPLKPALMVNAGILAESSLTASDSTVDDKNHTYLLRLTNNGFQISESSQDNEPANKQLISLSNLFVPGMLVASAIEMVAGKLKVALSDKTQRVNDDGELKDVLRLRIYSCNLSSRSCIPDEQLLQESSDFQNTSAVPAGISRLLQEDASLHNSQLLTVSQQNEEVVVDNGFNWWAVGIPIAITVLFGGIGGIAKHLSTKIKPEPVYKIVQPTEVQILVDLAFAKGDNDTPLTMSSELKPVVSDGNNISYVDTLENKYNKLEVGLFNKESLKKGLSTTRVSVSDFDELLENREALNPDIFSYKFFQNFNLKEINADKFSKKYLEKTFKDANVNDKKLNEYFTKNFEVLLNGDTSGELIKFLNQTDNDAYGNVLYSVPDDKGILYIIREDYKRYQLLTFLSSKEASGDNAITTVDNYKTRLLKNLLKGSAIGAGLGLVPSAAFDLAYFYGDNFRTTLLVTEPSCAQDNSCLSGKLYNINKQGLEESAVINNGFLASATAKTSNGNRVIKYYQMTANRCANLLKQFPQLAYVEVRGYRQESAIYLPLVDPNGNLCIEPNNLASLLQNINPLQ